MTTKNFGMMVIGMMLIGTTTVFGKTNTTVKNDRHFDVHTECNLRHIHNGSCNGTPAVDSHKIFPGMSMEMRKHIMSGHHVYGRHNECKICHLSKNDIKKIEREMHNNHNAPRPVVKTSHFGR